MMEVMEVRELPKPPRVHEVGNDWVKLDTGDSGLIAVFNPSNDHKRPSLHIGVEGVVDEDGMPVQVLRYDHHDGDPHKHRFAVGHEVRVPLFITDNDRLGALVDVFEASDLVICQDLVEVGHRNVAAKLESLGIAFVIAEQIDKILATPAQTQADV